jgi:hypothetical protein
MSFDDGLTGNLTNITGQSVPRPSSASSEGQRERNRQFLAQEGRKLSMDQMHTGNSFNTGRGEIQGTNERSMSLTEVLLNLDQIKKNRANAAAADVGAPLPYDVPSAPLTAQDLHLNSHPIIHEGVNEDSAGTNNNIVNVDEDGVDVDPRNLASMTGNFDDLSFLGGSSMSLVKGVLGGSDSSSMSSKASFSEDLEDIPVLFSSEIRAKDEESDNE